MATENGQPASGYGTDTFTFEVEYFKRSGKFYTSAAVNLTVSRTCSGAYMNDAVEQLRTMHSTGKLPGLRSGHWDGYIRITCDDGFPVLMLPE